MHRSTSRAALLSSALAALLSCCPVIASAAEQAARPVPAAGGKAIERGRYLVRIAGCNDCHTPAYAERGGAVPEKEWLTGSPVGFRGPWGTTYAANLRLTMAALSEDDWVRAAHGKQYRPPMPWFALRDMQAADLRAIYRFIRHPGPAGEPAPAFLGPGGTPGGPVVQFPG